jgi:RNA polymerase sigma-54 factor
MVQGQFQTQSLRPMTTAHLAQTMTLLSLAVDELGEQIEKELSTNPALELLEERRCPNCKKILPQHGKCPVCSSPNNALTDEPVVFVSPSEDFYSREYSPERDFNDDPTPPQTEDLPTYVLRQIATEIAEREKAVVAYLLTHLDEDGLLSISIIEVANYFHLLPSEVKRIQRIIQFADPIGVGSNTSQEAMLIQLEVLAETRTIPDKCKEVVELGLDLLSRHQFVELSKKVNSSTAQMHIVSQFISENLNPFPARSHWGDSRQVGPAAPDVYRQPDILISVNDSNESKRLIVEIVLPVGGTLRVNPDYRQAIKEVNEDAKGDMKNDLERASLFVKCLQQRNNTMQRMMSKIVGTQKEFILKGEKESKSMTRAEIAHELGVHESTISRAVAKKSVQLPNRRIVPLSMFFDRSLNVRTVLRDIISDETQPLSDFELVDILGKQGFKVARRTVAKYRSMEGILPAHLRHSTA